MRRITNLKRKLEIAKNRVFTTVVSDNDYDAIDRLESMRESNNEEIEELEEMIADAKNDEILDYVGDDDEFDASEVDIY